MNSAENSAAAHRSATPIHPPRVLLFCAIVLIWIALLVYPVLSNTYLPLFDLPNHIARLEILAHLEDPFFSMYYQFEPGIRANSTMDLFVVLSGWDGDIYALARWSMAFYLINFQLSALVLYRILWGHWSLWPLIAGLVAYSGPFFWGFQNFIVAVPFAIYVLALWIWSARFRLPARLLLLTGPIVAVYLLHSISFAILALAVCGYEAQILLNGERRDIGKSFLAAITLSLPFWLPVIHLASQISIGPDSAGKSQFGGLQSRFEALFSLTGTPEVSLDHWIEPINSAMVLLLILPVFLLRKRRARLQIALRGRGILTALALAALIAPEWLSGVWSIHTRIPFVLFLLFVSATRWRGLGRHTRYAAMTLACTVLLARVVSFDAYARLHTNEVADLLSVFGELDEGVSLSALSASEPPGTDFAWRRYQLEKYAVVERRALVPTLISSVHNLKFTRLWQENSGSGSQVHGCSETERDEDSPAYRRKYVLHVGTVPQEYRQNPLLRTVISNENFVILEDCR